MGLRSWVSEDLSLPGSWVFWLSGSLLAHKTHKFTSKRRFGTCVISVSFFSASLSFCVAVWASFFNFFSYFTTIPYCIIYFIDINFRVSIFYGFLMCCQKAWGVTIINEIVTKFNDLWLV